MTISDTAESAAGESKLHQGTNWWGAFVIGLAAPILVTGIDPPAIQALGAAAIPLLALTTVVGVLLCLVVAELAASMPHRTGGLPSYATESLQPLHAGAARHLGGVSAWAYWLGWFPVAPINMILASAYITQLFHIPQGRSFLPFGSIGSPISLAVLLISVAGILIMFVPSYLGIRLGAGFATVMGIVSMAPLTLLILLPLTRPSSMHLSNLSGFHFASGVTGSPTLILSWMFVMSWSVLGMEAVACYVPECRNPARDAKIATTAESLYGFAVFVLTAVVLVAVLGGAENVDPLTIFSTLISKVTGQSGSWVQYLIGIPLIVALMLSVLNALMGCARSLYQASEDGMLPRWFGKLNVHRVPARAMAFNVVCSIAVVLFGSPLRIYVFSNMGYLFAVTIAFFSYAVHRQTRPDAVRPLRLPGFMRWVSLALGVFCAIMWAFGGWNSPAIVVGTPSHDLFLLGVAIVAAYVPLHLWRRFSDRRQPAAAVLTGTPAESAA
ncbi:APC family permease [Nocardia sp. NPDC004722]